MYLDYFKLTSHPFQVAPDDRFLFQSSQHVKALVYMDYAVWDAAGFVVITGDVGTGKTTLVKRLLRNFDQYQYCFNLSYTFLDKGDLFRILLKQVDSSLKFDNKIDMLYQLHDFLVEKKHENIPVILIIDESQYLTAENLEEIRMLSGIEGKEGPLLRVILVGQPELYQNIAQVPQLYQRVKLHFQLRSLNEVETTAYINYRLDVAGLNKKTALFSRQLFSSIFKHTHGIPRLINKTCDALLMCAFADNKTKASLSDMDLILQDIMVETSLDIKSPINKPALMSSNNDNLEKILLRGVTALENIDKKLNFLVSTEMEKIHSPIFQYKKTFKNRDIQA
ncbi:MAG: AAA family ATPase [Pseudomonadales bacterium]|nr:AAA family ATPase [Pseudomonadales bacterium]